MMKSILLGLICCASAGVAAAQGLWSAPGATWTYSYRYFGQYGDMTVTYAGPTTVGGQAALRYSRQLKVMDQIFPNQPVQTLPASDLVLRADADQVYVLADDQQFYPLYNFAAQVGDAWRTPAATPNRICASTLVRLRVDSVGTATISGVARRWLRVRAQSLPGDATTYNYAWGGRIYEGLGPTESYLQPQGFVSCGGTDPAFLGALLCYRATGQQPYYGGTAQQCSALVTATATQLAVQAGFEVYPNPGSGELHLRLPAAVGTATIEIHDLTGRCVLRTVVPATSTLDVRQLPKGVYALSLLLPGQQMPATRRVMLQ